MERREDRLFYYCAIPRKIVVPEGFVSKEIASCKYMVVEHIGSMDKIYETYTKIYKEIFSFCLFVSSIFCPITEKESISHIV